MGLELLELEMEIECKLEIHFRPEWSTIKTCGDLANVLNSSLKAAGKFNESSQNANGSMNELEAWQFLQCKLARLIDKPALDIRKDERLWEDLGLG